MADDDVDLSPEQTEKLIHFQDLTMIEDIDRCKYILERHSWNIESAVTDTLYERDVASAPLTAARTQSPEPRMPSMNLTPRDQQCFLSNTEIFLLKAPEFNKKHLKKALGHISRNIVVYVTVSEGPRGVLQWISYAFMLPFRFFFTTFIDILKFAYRLVWPDPRRNVTDPVGDVIAFITKFKEDYGQNHPVFYQGAYSQAVNDAKRELRFLLVYLHEDGNSDSVLFCQNTLCDSSVIEFINSRMLFWACNVSSPEGYRVSRTVRVRKFPFLSLIVLRENNSMTVVARIEGRVDPLEFIRRLERAIDVNEHAVTSIRLDRERLNADKVLREEQDQAYLASLKADQEKERKKKEERDKVEEEEQRERDKVAEWNRVLMERERRKSEVRDLIPPEPAANQEGVVRIMLTVPSGAHLERRFLKTQSLKYLYYFILCNDQCPDDFKVLSNFPKGEVPCHPSEDNTEPPTFVEAGLDKSVRLFVHDNEA